MINSVATQCELVDQAEEHLVWRTREHAGDHKSSSFDEPALDINNKQDLERLRGWCREHWTSTLKKSFISKNQVFYHSCCNSFSRRAFSKEAGHPAFLSCNALTLPGFKNVDDAESLYRWFIKLAKDNSRIGERTLFPSVNKYHSESQDIEDETTEDTENADHLSMLYQELKLELERTKQDVKKLQGEKDRLLSSCSHWHSRYQELLEYRDQGTYFLGTPVKKLKLSNADSFEDDN